MTRKSTFEQTEVKNQSETKKKKTENRRIKSKPKATEPRQKGKT